LVWLMVREVSLPRTMNGSGRQFIPFYLCSRDSGE
jgi:hypothetical protein